jgi:biotin carboxyl carrier protein
MTRETSINGKPGRLRIERGVLDYARQDGESVGAAYSLQATAQGNWSVILNNRVYHVAQGPAGEFLVNGRSYAAELFDPRDRRAGGRATAHHGAQTVAAPMPGRVVRVLVAPGDPVEESQGLVVVEAMKMQNEMKSPISGRVVEVRTAPEATVTAGQVLVVVE